MEVEVSASTTSSLSSLHPELSVIKGNGFTGAVLGGINGSKGRGYSPVFRDFGVDGGGTSAPDAIGIDLRNISFARINNSAGHAISRELTARLDPAGTCKRTSADWGGDWPRVFACSAGCSGSQA